MHLMTGLCQAGRPQVLEHSLAWDWFLSPWGLTLQVQVGIEYLHTYNFWTCMATYVASATMVFIKWPHHVILPSWDRSQMVTALHMF